MRASLVVLFVASAVALASHAFPGPFRAVHRWQGRVACQVVEAQRQIRGEDPRPCRG
jgi:hypothetical protein